MPAKEPRRVGEKIFLPSNFITLALSDLVLMEAYFRLMVLSEKHPWASKPRVLMSSCGYEEYRDVHHYDNSILFFSWMQVCILPLIGVLQSPDSLPHMYCISWSLQQLILEGDFSPPSVCSVYGLKRSRLLDKVTVTGTGKWRAGPRATSLATKRCLPACPLLCCLGVV